MADRKAQQPRMHAAYAQILDVLGALDGPDDLLGHPELAGIRAAVWDAEQEEFYAPDLIFPHYGWGMIDHENGLAVRDKLRALIDAEEALSFSSALHLATLAWRFTGLSKGLADRLVQTAEAPSRRPLDSLSGADLFELLIILTDRQALEAMARVAKFTAAAPDLKPRLRPFVGDMLFLSSFHRHKLRGNQSKPATHILPLKESQALASRFAGEATLNTLIYDAMVKSLTGDMVGAERVHQHALTVSGGLTAQLRGARHILGKETIAAAINRANAGEPAPEPDGAAFRLDLRHDGQSDQVLFVATESVYFDKFGEVFIASAAATNPGILIHMHLVDFHLPEDRIIALEQAYGVRLNFSYDHFLKTDHVKAYGDYIVNARFIYLDRVLPLYATVFLSDIDGLIHRPLTKYQLKEVPGVLFATRIDLAKAHSKNALWGSVSGGIFGVSNTETGKLFTAAMAHLMAEKIQVIRREGGRLFFADQTALAQLYLALRGRVPFRAMEGPFFQQAEDVPGADRLLNKELWQDAKLAEIKSGKLVDGRW